MMKTLILLLAAALQFTDHEPANVKSKKHGRELQYVFGAERIGYVTARGKPVLGDAEHPVAVTHWNAAASNHYEEGEVVFHEAVCPNEKLNDYFFECSNGRVLEFWDDAMRLTKNRVIAEALGDEELKSRYVQALAEKHVTSLNAVIRRCLEAKNLTMIAAKIPTKSGAPHVYERETLPNLVKAPFPAPTTAYDYTKIQLEKLGRGFVVFRHKDKATRANAMVCSWRYLPTDPTNVAFNVYADGRKVNAEPIVNATHYLAPANKATRWELEVIGGGPSRTPAPTAGQPVGPDLRAGRIPAVLVSDTDCFTVPLAPAPDRQTPDGETYRYIPDEAGVGDLDGDGEYELVVKRQPSIAKDNSQDGYTGETLVEAYKLTGGPEGARPSASLAELGGYAPSGDEGGGGFSPARPPSFLWRIDLGRNIRSGAHYTQLLVYDFDGDGRAEVVLKTADGTTDGTGKVIGDANADWRGTGGRPPKRRTANTLDADEEDVSIRGRILAGPEYLTVFDGRTGGAVTTVPYDPPRGDLESWGDTYGNRCDRFLAAAAYLDGVHPSIIESRGYYAKTVITAWDFKGGRLVKRWQLDSSAPGNADYAGQGFHNLRIADVDFDGKDEIVFGSMVVDDDGKGLYSTLMRHGDNQHLVQARPDMKGLQEFTCHEESGDGLVLRDAQTGRKIWQHRYPFDVPMCVAADFDPKNPGYEFWMGKDHPIWSASGRTLPGDYPTGWHRFLLWWKGDMLRSVYGGGDKIFSWNTETSKWDMTRLRKGKGKGERDKSAGKGRKLKNPVLTADILGDWREEIVLPANNDQALVIYSSPDPTPYRFWTFMLDPVYRLSVCCWPICYNQSPQTGFYFGPDLLGHGIWFRGCYLR